MALTKAFGQDGEVGSLVPQHARPSIAAMA
jgi:hypothetical protein